MLKLIVEKVCQLANGFKKIDPFNQIVSHYSIQPFVHGLLSTTSTWEIFSRNS